VSLNPVVRARLTRSAFRVARGFGRSRAYAAWCAVQMLFVGHVRRYSIHL